VNTISSDSDTFDWGYAIADYFKTIKKNGNKTDWSPIQSVIMRVINKVEQVLFVNQRNDYRPNWMTRCPVTNLL